MAVQDLHATPLSQNNTQRSSSVSTPFALYCTKCALFAGMALLAVSASVQSNENTELTDEQRIKMYERRDFHVYQSSRRAAQREARRSQRLIERQARRELAERLREQAAIARGIAKQQALQSLTASAFADFSVANATAPHKFTTYNNRLFAPTGEEFIARGINIFPWNDAARDLEGIADCWNFNLVRVHSWILPEMTNRWKDHVVYFGEPLTFDPTTVALRTYDLTPLIDAYTEAGIVVVLSLHDFVGGYYDGEYQADYLAVLAQIAERYKDNPYLWIDIHNEPGRFEGRDGDYSRWRAQMMLALDTVRAIAPDKILWLSGTAWGQDTGPHWGHAPVNPDASALLANDDLVNAYDNLVLTVHTYDQWQYGQARLEDYFRQLTTHYEHPIIVGEYGPALSQSATLPTPWLLHDVLQQAEFASVGRVAWTWAATDANDLVSVADGSGYWIDSCTTPLNLTPFGQLIWNDNHTVQ